MYNLISRGVQSGVKYAVKKITLTATQKTAAQFASKVAIATATTTAAMVVNTKVQEHEAKKIEQKASKSLEDYDKGEAESPMNSEEINALAKKGQLKANVTSGVVIGIGSAASTLLDVVIKTL